MTGRYPACGVNVNAIVAVEGEQFFSAELPRGNIGILTKEGSAAEVNVTALPVGRKSKNVAIFEGNNEITCNSNIATTALPTSDKGLNVAIISEQNISTMDINLTA